MPRHDPASRARIADYQCRHNGGNGSDPDLSREHGAESRFDVKAADGVLHVTNNTLDLDDHHHADGGCVRQKVDAPPVSEWLKLTSAWTIHPHAMSCRATAS